MYSTMPPCLVAATDCGGCTSWAATATISTVPAGAGGGAAAATVGLSLAVVSAASDAATADALTALIQFLARLRLAVLACCRQMLPTVGKRYVGLIPLETAKGDKDAVQMLCESRNTYCG